MTYEKFVKHASFVRPTVVVVRRPKRGARGAGGARLGGSVGMAFPPFAWGSAVGAAAAGGGAGGGAGPGPMGLGLLASPVPGGNGGEGGYMAAIPFAFGALDTDASFG